ncbi:MAG: ribosome-associated translation inhibitor RaiA [Eubacteriales bacterium]|nr:ribosome-associated translation inhibitor RaiA [Eubacteriales bacterium]
MRIKIDGQGMKVSERVQERVEKKLSKFDRYFGDAAEARVKFRPEGPQLLCETTFKVGKHFYRAEAISQQADEAFDQTVSIMEGQLRRHKAKFKRRAHDFAYLNTYMNEDLEDFEAEDEESYEIRRKQFPIEAMHEDEAILQMEMLGHNFYIFLNPDSGRANVVYKRRNGSYGLIEAEY